MREISIENGPRTALRDVLTRRKERWPLLILVAGVAFVALVVGGRSAPAQIAPPAREPRPTASPSPTVGVLVHVAGAVRRPGLYEFPPGARVADAVDSAGGPRPGADLNALNLAELLVDGTKVLVTRVGEPPAPTAPPATAAGSALAAPIPLNDADQALLETIPGVGPVTAAAILQYRAEIGRFVSLDQLLEVDGIGPATFESVRDYVAL